MEIYLGKPSDKFIQWCKDHYGPAETEIKTKMTYSSSVLESSIVGAIKASDTGIVYYDWEGLVDKLEDYPNQTANLPAVGTYLSTSYEIGDDEYVPMEWQILGYNGSIPEYVKYKDTAGNKVYVKSVKSGLLAAIAANDTVYTRDEANMYTDSGKTVGAISSGSFTYGNNCAWTVPDSITVDGTSYAFAGYNVTLASKLALGVKYDGKLYTYCQFDSNSGDYGYGQSDWSTSMLRIWMNGEGDTNRLSKQIWHDYAQNYFTYGKGIKPLRTRFNDNAFADHVQNTVNRTWVHSSWRSGKTLDSNSCEHVIDKFWTLGIGNINCTGKSSGTEYFKDTNYDTNKFDSIFTPVIDVSTNNDSRKRNYMTASGSYLSTPCTWWLRSANINYNSGIGCVNEYGNIGDNCAIYSFGVLPACTIC